MKTIEPFPGLPPQIAQASLNALVGGEPPSPEIVDLISVGLERDINTFEKEFFRPSSFVVSPETEGSAFKMVEAYYGGGKTHYLRAVERAAHRSNFASAFVGLRKDECPLTRFDLVYQAVAGAIAVPRGDGLRPVRGIGPVIRHWVDTVREGAEDPILEVHRKLDELGDAPLMSLKMALRIAAFAHASGDGEEFDAALVYLTNGKIPPSLRKQGVVQAIDAKNGSLALRTIATLVRKLGYAGFILILDEGDRSLSIVSSKEKKAASNNLVQLINEAASPGAWPSTLLLYSIPSWQSFSDAFSNNQALIQRTEGTGFPMVPPAPRIVLDERQRDHASKEEFCRELATRLNRLFRSANPDDHLDPGELETASQLIVRGVLEREIDSSYRRMFVQAYISAIYWVRSEGVLTPAAAEKIVSKSMDDVQQAGN
jgi:hypothetical protein